MNIDEIEQGLTRVDIEEVEAFRKTQETVILVMMFIDMDRNQNNFPKRLTLGNCSVVQFC